MPSDLPEVISSFGGDIDAVFTFIFYVVNTWLVLTEATLLYFLVKYRRKKGVRGQWLPADTWRAAAFILVPVALVVVCDFAIEAKSHGVWDLVKISTPKHDVLVRITGRQFAWSFTYAGADGKLDTADDFQTSTELHVPINKVVRFQLESVDVLHSFFVPALRLKQDAVPGRSIRGWFKAQKNGKYEIGCAEICGVSHTSMRAILTVQSPKQFQVWSSTHAQQQARLEVSK